MPRVGAEHVGLDAAGRDGVDGDALGAGVGGEGAREAFDGRFGAGVEGVVGNAGHVRGDRGHEDDAAAAWRKGDGMLTRFGEDGVGRLGVING